LPGGGNRTGNLGWGISVAGCFTKGIWDKARVRGAPWRRTGKKNRRKKSGVQVATFKKNAFTGEGFQKSDPGGEIGLSPGGPVGAGAPCCKR